MDDELRTGSTKCGTARDQPYCTRKSFSEKPHIDSAASKETRSYRRRQHYTWFRPRLTGSPLPATPRGSLRSVASTQIKDGSAELIRLPVLLPMGSPVNSRRDVFRNAVACGADGFVCGFGVQNSAIPHPTAPLELFHHPAVPTGHVDSLTGQCGPILRT